MVVGKRIAAMGGPRKERCRSPREGAPRRVRRGGGEEINPGMPQWDGEEHKPARAHACSIDTSKTEENRAHIRVSGFVKLKGGRDARALRTAAGAARPPRTACPTRVQHAAHAERPPVTIPEMGGPRKE